MHLHRVFRLVVEFPTVDVVVEVYEFEVFSAYAVVTFHRVFGGIFIIMVIYRLAPVHRGCAVVFYDRTKRNSLNIRWYLHAGIVEESRCEIDIHTERVGNCPSLYCLWITNQKRHPLTLLIHKAFVKPSVLAEEKSLVGGVNHDSIVQFTRHFEIVQHTTDALVHRKDSRKIIPHILLVFPADEFLPFKTAATVLRDTSGIDRIPFVLRLLRHTEIDLRETVVRIGEHFLPCQQFEIPILCKSLFKTHILLCSSGATA